MATFGKIDIGDLIYWGGQDRKNACRFQLTEDGIVSKITAYIRCHTGTADVKFAIYSDDAGAPGALKGVTDEVTDIDTVWGWRDFVFSSPVSLSAGYYWLADIASARLCIRYATGATDQWTYNTTVYGDGFPDPFKITYTFTDYETSVYATYTPLAPPPIHSLSIDSSPITGVPITINGVEVTTPYIAALEEGTHVIIVPTQVIANDDIYNFVRWEDETINPERTVNLMADMALIATYELAPTPTKHLLTVDSTPIQGVPFTIEQVI